MQLKPEYPKSYKKGMKKLAIVYPNRRCGGVYTLATHIIYNLVNALPDWICEQRFLEDSSDLSNFDLVGFTWQYELDLNLIKKIIKENKIKRSFAGGPCVNSNPGPLEGLIDFFVLGEVEGSLAKILENYDSDEKLSKMKGVYLPNKNKKSLATDSKFYDYPIYQPMPKEIDSSYVFGKAFILELERGCPFSCNFCPMPCTFKVKYRPLENLKEIIKKGLKLNNRDKVVIYSPSFTHPKRKEVLQYLLDNKIKFSVPSIKAEHMDKDTLELIYQGGQKSLTIAPECGESLRPSLNKRVKDSKYLDFVRMAEKFSSLKLYFMLGLPNQDEKDLDEILILIDEIKKVFKGKVSASFNPFVPKKGTAFENEPLRKKEIKEQEKYLKKKLKINAKFSSISTAGKVYKISTL